MNEQARQYSFICNKHGFTVSLLDGYNIIESIINIHNIGPHALGYYNKTLLSSLQMLNYLKAGENLGFYIDSEEPYFRYKIELNFQGTFRTLLLPEEFEDFPTHLQGKCRITKMMAGQATYTSIIELNEHPVDDIINEVIEKSYQVNSKILVNPETRTSLMLTKLPPSNVNKKIEDFDDLDLETIQTQYADLINNALNLQKTNVAEAEKLFSSFGLNYIGSKEVKFFCPCSKQRMINNLFTLPENDLEEIFHEKDSIEIRCDYCNTIYDIHKSEIHTDLH